MKFSKILVGFATVLLLASCGNPAPESESAPESTPTTQHTISFHANWNYGEPVDGEPAVKTLTVDAGTVVATESIPVADERPGYAFKTWCTTPAATIAFDWTRAIERDKRMWRIGEYGENNRHGMCRRFCEDGEEDCRSGAE